MKKVVYADMGKSKDSMIFRDESGKRLELTGPEVRFAKMTAGGMEKLYRKKVMPEFCAAGEGLEVRRHLSESVLWKSE